MMNRILTWLGLAPEPMLSERELAERECEAAALALASYRAKNFEVAP